MAWLSTIDNGEFNDRQRLGLAYLWRNKNITNRQYRLLAGMDVLVATQDLTGLASAGFVDKISDKRWTVWCLADKYLEHPNAPAAPFEPMMAMSVEQPRGGGRRKEIEEFLMSGPKSSQEIADHLGMSRPGVMRWLRLMEQDGVVKPTSYKRKSKLNLWELTGRG